MSVIFSARSDGDLGFVESCMSSSERCPPSGVSGCEPRVRELYEQAKTEARVHFLLSTRACTQTRVSEKLKRTHMESYVKWSRGGVRDLLAIDNLQLSGLDK